jgi:hypothetical protein
MIEQFPLQAPRFLGVVEQYQRARWLLGSATKAPNAETRFRMLILAIYPARSITEIMLEAAFKQELKGYQEPDANKNRKNFETTHLSTLPFYLLIEKIRIHDFHRFGCVLDLPQVFYGGRTKLTASQGEAAIFFPLAGNGGKEILTTGNSNVEEQRALLRNGDAFFDDSKSCYVKLDRILLENLNAIVPVISQFKDLIGS